MSEQLQGPRVSVEYCRSELQIANGLTKIIPPAEWPHTMTQFGMTASGDGFHLDAVVANPTVHSIPAEIIAASCQKIPSKQHLIQVDSTSSWSRQEGGTRKCITCLCSCGVRFRGLVRHAEHFAQAPRCYCSDMKVIGALHARASVLKHCVAARCSSMSSSRLKQCRGIQEPSGIAQSSPRAHPWG